MALCLTTKYLDDCRRLNSILKTVGVQGTQAYDAFNEPRYTLTWKGQVIAEGNDRLAALEEAREYVYALNRLQGKSR